MKSVRNTAFVTTPKRVNGQVVCVDCEAPVYPVRPGVRTQLRCPKCCNSRERAMTVARGTVANMVRAAVLRGQLMPASAYWCTDCERPACDYDHRDYTRPFDVDPVCRRCNVRRGHALVWPAGVRSVFPAGYRQQFDAPAEA